MTLEPEVSTSDLARPRRRHPLYLRIRRFYREHLEHRLVLNRMVRQRVKLLWFVWGYSPLFRVTALSPWQRAWLLWRCLRIDWNVPLAHEPVDCAWTLVSLGERRANPGEVMVEAGCWQGGSTAKWSLACQLLGYRLHVYDSFQGVEARTDVEGRYDFTGEYAATLSSVRSYVARYGDLSVCTFHPGWFCDTIGAEAAPWPIRLAYIDCDLVKGTKEVLTGVVPALTDDGVIVSQDGQVPVVAQLLAETATWQEYGVRVRGTRYSRHLLVFHLTERASRTA